MPNTFTTTMSRNARTAFVAFDLLRTCGDYAARRFAAKHGPAVLRCFTLIRQLEAVEGL